MTNFPAMAKPDIIAKHQAEAIYLRSREPLRPYASSMGSMFFESATRQGDDLWLADRGTDQEDWRTLSWSEGLSQGRRLGSAVRALGGSGERPLMVLSGNSLEHGLMTVASYLSGVPVCPVSTAYSLVSKDFQKLRSIVSTVSPGVVFADEYEPFAKALAVVRSVVPDVTVITGGTDRPSTCRGLEEVIAGSRELDPTVTANISGQDIAKILFTSGSTDVPKGVINTNQMLTSNQEAMSQVWTFLDDEPLVLADWLPWSHTFGGNHNFNMVIRRGGTFHIDRGKPVAALMGLTVANLRSVQPTVIFNVPAGFAALAQHLEADPQAAAESMANLRLIFYAAAALPPETWTRLTDISVRATGSAIPMTSSWGATETAPAATSAHYPLSEAGVIGVPIPGVELKLTAGTKSEVRVKGPNVTPGYFRRPDLTAAAFDDEGYYSTGDAVRLADPSNPNAGIIFDGRITEDFKLATGTWVSVGTLRVKLLDATAGLFSDAAITGENLVDVGAIVWPSPLAAAKFECALTDLCENAAFRAEVTDLVESYNAAHAQSSARIGRISIASESPSLDANEITDKGYLNQRSVLSNPADVVDSLYDDECPTAHELRF